MKNDYDKLIEKYKEIYTISTISSVLYWDMNTYMPPSALEFRSNQFNWLQQTVHKKWISREMEDLIKKCEKKKDLDLIQQRNVVLMRRAYDNRTVLPLDLVGELASQSNKTLEIWKKAKVKNDFSIVKKELKKLFALELKRAQLLAEAKGIQDPYEALIDTHDHGFSIKILSKLFNEAKSFLVPLVEKCVNSTTKPERSFLRRKVPRKVQIQIVNDLVDFLGYDKRAGRIDEVEHPLTIGCGPKDVRLTVKYREDKIMGTFLAGAHECGHSLHGQQRNPEWIGQPINGYGGPSFGESQSRLIENHITLSKDFWDYYYPKFQISTDTFNDVELDTFHFAINATHPGSSRLGADELTYVLHIIIRFELEQELFAGKVDIGEIPDLWNERYEKYLGIKVRSDTEGVMQDLHWFSQYWGYFYGYGIGDIMAAQIVQTGLDKSLPDWRDELKNGDFSPVRLWLAKNIHSKGAMYDGLDFIEKITGEQLTVKYFKNYLERKYQQMYGF
ncbi:MAG: carboxypeptidase M32 [Candidatus Hodarchaeales archaeon]